MFGKSWITAGAICAAISVALGAFGAHSLPKQLEKSGVEPAKAERRLQNLETGARYQMYHALALLAIGVWQVSVSGTKPGQSSAWLFLIGILLFSGSLYAYAFTGITKFGMITPLGGLAMIIGWALLAF